MNNIRTGVIGVGSMGQNHARVYSEISNLVAVSDLNSNQSQKVANRFGVKSYNDYREMLREVDAVTISTPTSLHREIAEEVVSSGVSILVEKPLADNVEDAEAIIEAAKANDVTLAVGHIERHNQVVKAAKENIVKGTWGEILTLSAKRLSNYPGRIRDVGVLFDLAIHDVDIISYLLDDTAINVYATGGKHRNKNYEDHVNLQINFGKGGIGICEANWLTPMKIRELSITTNELFVRLDYLNQKIEVMSSTFGKINESNLYDTSIKLNREVIDINGEEPLKNELLDFLSSLNSSSLPLVTGEDGLDAIKIVQAGFESLKSNRVVGI